MKPEIVASIGHTFGTFLPWKETCHKLYVTTIDKNLLCIDHIRSLVLKDCNISFTCMFREENSYTFDFVKLNVSLSNVLKIFLFLRKPKDLQHLLSFFSLWFLFSWCYKDSSSKLKFLSSFYLLMIMIKKKKYNIMTTTMWVGLFIVYLA